jgi:ADP-ribose pyrophosphatase YjhB (NUDIX family)
VPRHFCVQCGAPLVIKIFEGRELEACPNDDFVLWRDPKVAAAIVVAAPGGVLLGRRGIEPGQGLWCLPGGFVNHDEDPADAVVRECREEICARVDVDGVLDVYHSGKTTTASIVVIAYHGRIVEGETPTAGDEMLEVAVFPLSALPELAFPSHRQALAKYAAERAETAAPPSPAQAEPTRSHTP